MLEENKKKYDVNVCKAEASIVGILEKDFEYRKLDGIEYLSSSIGSKRLSGVVDSIPIYLPVDSSVDPLDFKRGDTVCIEGDIRTFLKNKNGRHLMLVKVNSMEHTFAMHQNKIFVNGFVCTKPVCRRTPKGRIISDFRLAVNTPEGSMYIPSICWGNTAQECETYDTGRFIVCSGEFHSREYIKRFDDGTEQVMTAYECSYRSIE